MNALQGRKYKKLAEENGSLQEAAGSIYYSLEANELGAMTLIVWKGKADRPLLYGPVLNETQARQIVRRAVDKAQERK